MGLFKNKIVYQKSEELKDVSKMINELKRLNNSLSEKDCMIESIQKDYKKMFNLFSDVIIMIDKTGTIIDLNPSAGEFSECFPEVIIGKKWKNVITEMGCNWSSTIEKGLLEDNKLEEASKEIYIHKTNKHFIITILPIIKNDVLDYFIFTAKDITEIKKREIELIKKQKLIGYISDITEVFSQNINIDHILNKIVETMGKIEYIDRCCLYKNCIDSEGKFYAEKIKEWSSSKVPISNLKLNKMYYSGTFNRWKAFFDLNHILCGHVDDFPNNESYILKLRNIKSVCAVPIYTPLDQWGFIKFDSCLLEKKWLYDEERILKIAANIIGAGIYQWSLRNSENEIIHKSCINF